MSGGMGFENIVPKMGYTQNSDKDKGIGQIEIK